MEITKENSRPRRSAPMRRDYDIFEKFPDGSSIWRAWVCGQRDTLRKINDLARHSKNEFFAIDIQAGEIAPLAGLRTERRAAVKRAAAG